jgi:hypothetical protein
MKKSRITDEMYATIPGLIAQGLTHFEIAAQFGVKPNSLKVLCSQRGISLRKGGRRLPSTTLSLPDEPLPLSDGVLRSLREARGQWTARLGWSAISWRRSPATVSTRPCWTRRPHDDLASAGLCAW